jgi:hypothetical protein
MGNGEWVMVSQRGHVRHPHERLQNPEGGNGEWGMGNGEWGMGNGEKPNYQLPITNSQFPMPHAQCRN